MSATLLVVDDEQSLLDLLEDYLRLAGYEVVTAIDGESAIQLVKKEKFDLVITDVNMPNLNGFELIEQLRAYDPEIPVIVLSARNSKIEVTSGLRIGADDYVAKPFGLEELSLRVAAILRRTRKDPAATILRCGPIALESESHKVTLHDHVVELSPTEFALLHELLLNKEKMVPKQVLMRRVWNIGFTTDSNVLGTYISYLRRKLHTPAWQGIKTVRGLGFQIVENAE